MGSYNEKQKEQKKKNYKILERLKTCFDLKKTVEWEQECGVCV